MDGLRYSPDDPYYRLGPVHTCLYVRVRETGDWDLFLGPMEAGEVEGVRGEVKGERLAGEGVPLTMTT